MRPSGSGVRVATDADAASIRAFAERPMAGLIRLSVRRETAEPTVPDPCRQRERTVVLTRSGSNRVVAVGRRSVWRVFWQGRPTRVGYLSGLQAGDRVVGRRRLAAAFAELDAGRRDDEEPFDVTAIVADNQPARRLLERGLPGCPAYRPLVELTTLVVATRRRRRVPRVADLHPFDPADGAELLAFWHRSYRDRPLAPAWDARELEAGGGLAGLTLGATLLLRENGRPVAAGTVWDQRDHRQTRVEGYAPWLGLARPIVNLGLGVLGRPRLPPPGTVLPLAFVAGFAVEGDDPARAAALLEALARRAREQGIRQLALTLPHAHPLRAPLAARFAAQPYRSVLYTVTRPEMPPPSLAPGLPLPHLEAGLL